jgi:enoyl-CoA hydratase/carnithine racemase
MQRSTFVSAQQALDWGLVQRVAPAGRVAEVLDQIARELAALRPHQCAGTLISPFPTDRLVTG